MDGIISSTITEKREWINEFKHDLDQDMQGQILHVLVCFKY